MTSSSARLAGAPLPQRSRQLERVVVQSMQYVGKDDLGAIVVCLNRCRLEPLPGGRRPKGMPPFGHVLGDEQVATLVTYPRASWGNAAGPVSSAEVNRYRSVPLD